MTIHPNSDFIINSEEGVSTFFLERRINNFQSAANFIQKLPYRRNQKKDDLLHVLNENCGTCSTKHAVLKRLAEENNHQDIRLIVGIFKMNSTNTPAIGSVLEKYKIDYIPEAHTYLKIDNQILDYTGLGNTETDLPIEYEDEIEINTDQITDFKVQHHQNYLKKWLETQELPYSLGEFWNIREKCIREIAKWQCSLSTDRLLMRPFEESDGPIMYSLNDDIEVLQYTGDTHFANQTAARVFLSNYSQYEEFGVGRLLCILKDTQEVVGWCGLKYHPEYDEYDIGYRFFKKHWGKGYATETAAAALRYGFESLKIKRVVGRARIENQASINVFKKLKMQIVENYREDNQNWTLYEINNDFQYFDGLK